MKRLMLMRHGTAQISTDVKDHSGQFTANDRERLLSVEGRYELEMMHSKLQGEMAGLNQVFCSNAKRTRQTYETIKSLLPSSHTVSFEDSLYNADAKDLAHHLEGVRDDPYYVMVIGHNPAIRDFVNSVILSTGGAFSVSSDFPASGVAIFEGNFDHWHEAAPARFALKALLYP